MGGITTRFRGTTKRLLVGTAAVLALLLVLVLLLQSAYLLFPAPANETTRALDARLAARPRDTDNGLRLHGLNAPAALDPVAYGRCVLTAERDHDRSLAPQSSAGIDARTRDERIAACAQDHPVLDLPDKDSLPAINLASDLQAWERLAQVPVDPLLMTRFVQVLSGPPRHLGTGLNDSIPRHLGALLRLHQIRTAQALLAWHDGRTREALDQWEAAAGRWRRLAVEDPASSMSATSAMSATLVSMQAAWRFGPAPTDPQDLERIHRITHATDGMPEAFQASLLIDWGMATSVVRAFTDPSPDTAPSEPAKATALAWTGALLFGPHDHLNRTASRYAAEAPYLAALARGESPPQPTPPGCRSNGPITWQELLCLPVSRNPLGQITFEFAETPPDYRSYALRVADLRNLAAVTRLVAVLRAQAPEGPAQAQRVQQAPADQRDTYTGQPFVLDPASPALTVQLRHRNPWLGEAGIYRVPL